MTIKRFFAELSKVEDEDDGTIKVYGYASTGAEDADGECVQPEAMKAALPGYMKWGAVREMHQPKAAGTAIEAKVDDDGRTWFGAHVVDSEAIKKVKASVYKGFSIGGKVTGRDKLNKSVITGINLVEVSLVDRPANPEARIELWKGEGIEADPADPSAAAIDALAELLNKGAIEPARLVELAQAELAKAATAPSSDAPATSSPSSSEASAAPAEPAASEPAQGGELAKSMYTVSQFASVLSAVADLAASSTVEASWEGDNSPVPQAMRDWLNTGAGIFAAMAAEEVTELVNSINQVAADSAKAAGITLAKKGAKFSAASRATLGDIHKAMLDCCSKLDGLGYKTADDGDDDAAMAALTADLAKAHGTLHDLHEAIAKAAELKEGDEVLPALEALIAKAARVPELEAELTRLKAMPAPGKALLKALGKAQDVGEPVTAKADDLTPPPGATPEQIALLEVKKVLRGGGVPIHQFR